MALYFYAISKSIGGWTFSVIFTFQEQAIYMRDKGISCRKILWLKHMYLRYQIHALTAHE